MRWTWALQLILRSGHITHAKLGLDIESYSNREQLVNPPCPASVGTAKPECHHIFLTCLPWHLVARQCSVDLRFLGPLRAFTAWGVPGGRCLCTGSTYPGTCSICSTTI